MYDPNFISGPFLLIHPVTHYVTVCLSEAQVILIFSLLNGILENLPVIVTKDSVISYCNLAFVI